jgi:outer membrane protein assembly factor BamB
MAQTADLFVGAANGNSVRRYEGQTGAFLGDFTSGGANSGQSCPVFRPNGDLYVGEWSLAQPPGTAVRRYDRASGVLISTVVDSTLGGASAILFGRYGSLLAVGTEGDLNRYDPLSGAYRGTLVARGSGGWTSNAGMRFGPDGNLYLVNTALDTGLQILKYNGATGAFMGVFVAAGSGGLGSAGTDLVFGADGNLYVADFLHDAIYRFDGTTGAFIDVFASGGGLKAPWGLAFGADKNLYVASEGNSAVLRFDGKTGQFIDTFASATFPNPTYITFGVIPQILHPHPPGLSDKFRVTALVTQILAGVLTGGPGVVIPPGRGPTPEPPPSPIWFSLSPAEQDLLVGLVISKVASLINHPQVRKSVEKAVLGLAAEEINRLVESLRKE